MNKILDLDVFDGMINIDPSYISYPFITCYEMSLLSVVKYYKKSILPLMTKMNFAYKFNGANEDIIFLSINPDFDDRFDLLKSLRLERRTHEVEETNAMNCIRECISNDHPVQFMIDLFYQKGREYFYNFQHGGHYVNGYGFDDEKKIIHIIDNVQGYAKYTVKYEEFSTLRGEVQGSPIWEFVNCDDSIASSEEYDNRMIDMYCKGIKDQYDMRKDSLHEIEKLIDVFPVCASKVFFVENINGVLYNKISELCRIIYLRRFGIYDNKSSDSIEELLKRIIDKWKKIHSLLYYKKISQYSGNDFGKEISCLTEIIDIEKELCESLVKCNK